MNIKVIAALSIVTSALAIVAATTFSDAAVQASTARADPGQEMTIYRAPGCGCCDSYAEYMEKNGYSVTVKDDRNFDQRSVDAGVPARGIGCHLAVVDGYLVSGLVPAEIVDRLLEERPDIKGITLPGMPPNAPGMAAVKSGTLKIYGFGDEGISVYSNE
ncbi:DUF411 domain-containing protein [Candidatus Halocynthiibacter alkanivorans]|jgi:hypothetical protein|uniref:DUF411 domain-containing protein n=1 Tax=Candidatus Halocynthiibacter alkanivorans TaxID=2267619 RepID=UPI000DF4A2BC|nr:DUF411 domain-containing protein [Candidatus Halocynthiibacter alkanivorans]